MSPARAPAAPRRATPPIDPRIEARRVEVRREVGRRRRRALLVALTALAALGATVGAAASPLLDVDRVQVEGVGTRADAVQAAAQVAPGTPLVRVDRGAVAARVERLPWVAHATVGLRLPGTVEIRVVPATTVAWGRRGEGPVALFDRRGRVVARAAVAPVGVPELTWLRRVPAPGARVRPRVGAAVAAALPRALRVRTASIAVIDDHVVLGLADGPQVRLGAPTRLAVKLRTAQAVLGALVDPATYVDVSVPSTPVSG